MTGQEPNREELLSQITELEALAEAYRAALRREKEALYQQEAVRKGPVRRFFSRVRGKIRRTVRKLREGGRPHTAGGSAPVLPAGSLALDAASAAERTELYFRKERIAVYTALFGGYDILRDPLFLPDNIDYYVFTDRSVPAESRWQKADISQIPPEFGRDPVLANRWCKLHPHCLFPEHSYSVYIDANIWVLSDLTPVTATLDVFPAAMFRHKRRDCVYDEVEACILQKKADPASLRAHGELLRSHGIPEHWGLLEASIIARKHADPRCVELMEAWWEAFLANSRRDQISLIDTLWKAGIEPGRVGVLGSNLQRCDLFLQMRHPGDDADQPRNLAELQARIRG